MKKFFAFVEFVVDDTKGWKKGCDNQALTNWIEALPNKKPTEAITTAKVYDIR